MKIKRLRLITLCIVSLISVNVMAFDFGSIIAGAVKDAVTEVATDVAKDSTKAAAKSVAKSQGIEGADQYIDAAVENAENIQNVQGSVANASASAGALKGLAGSGPLGAASAVLSSAGIAQDTVKLGSAVGRPDQEYMAISSSMGSCKDNPCILKHQQQLINLQKRAEAYQVNTGDANLDGQVDGYDVRQAKINAAMAKIHSCSSADQKCKNQGYEQLRAVDNLASAQNGEATNAHPAATVATEAMGKLMGSFGFGK